MSLMQLTLHGSVQSLLFTGSQCNTCMLVLCMYVLWITYNTVFLRRERLSIWGKLKLPSHALYLELYTFLNPGVCVSVCVCVCVYVPHSIQYIVEVWIPGYFILSKRMCVCVCVCVCVYVCMFIVN